MKHKTISIFLNILLLFLSLLTFSLRWGIATFGNVTVDEIVFHIVMPLTGTSGDIVRGYLLQAVLPAVLIWAGIWFWIAAPVSKGLMLRFGIGDHIARIGLFPLHLPPLLWTAGILFWGLMLGQTADRAFSVRAYIQGQLQRSSFIEEAYVPPADVQLEFPEKKKNLICIFAESMESSAQDYASGGVFPQNYIPELTRLAKENVSFSQSDLIEGSSVAPGCSWTIAGMVAQTSGMVCKLPLNYDMRNEYDFFLPGVVSLGEILQKEGYRNYFMAGSDFSFGGRRRYFTSHGDYAIYDYNWARMTGRIPLDYKRTWGFEDRVLFSLAKEMITEAAAQEGPFNFSMLTVDTHTPDGYFCELCRNEYDEKYANVYACASRQISSFVEWAKTQDWYEDTVIWISGDHLSMDPDFYGAYLAVDYENNTGRKVYNVFVNPAAEPVKENDRRFTTLDMFPSVLGAMGVRIPGERLGLGTNLFADAQTLSEEYGYEYLFSELGKRSNYYDRTFLYPHGNNG